MPKTDILENAETYTLSDFQNLKLAESYKKLYSKSILENKRREQEKYNKRVYNLSMKNLFENFFTVWTYIVNDMTELMYDDTNNKDINNYIIVLTKDDRILYVGMMFILLSLICYFIFLTK
jgi:hypothetical protein